MRTLADDARRVKAQMEIEIDRTLRTRTAWALSSAMIAVSALVAFGANDRQAVFNGVAALRVFVVLLGVLAVTSEHQHGDVVWRYLIEPSRSVHVIAKAMTNALIGAILGMVALEVGVVVTMVRLGAPAGAGPWQSVAGAIGGVALAGVYGVGIGAAVRNQTAAVVGTLVGVLIIEPLVTAVAPAVGAYLPGAAAVAAAGKAGAAWIAASAATLAYAVAAAVAGGVLCSHSDV